MGAVLGLLLGCGLLLVWSALTSPAPATGPRRSATPLRERLTVMLRRAGADQVTPAALIGLCVGLAVIVGLAVYVISGVATVGAAFGAFAAYGPIALLRGRARRALRERAEVWPDVVDDLASGVRAGLSLPEALTRVGERGPLMLRPTFAKFGTGYQRTGRFGDALDVLKADLADPVGDRVVEALRIARDVGGGDLGSLLRSLSTFLRADLRTRSELESRQSWTVNAARLAVAAPWAVLLLMSFQRDVVGRYASLTGAVVLIGGAGVCVVAYRLMVRIGRLPVEQRVLA
ncbi:MAG: type II secretion system F family protein [Nocardioidaceae bacterium]|nr:type II secretion system F family protein [Nocardioidaceae bacterium]